MENNFKKIYKDKVSEFEETSTKRIESNIQSNLSTFRLIGNFFELFLPKQIIALTSLLDNKNQKAIDQQNKPDRYPKI